MVLGVGRAPAPTNRSYGPLSAGYPERSSPELLYYNCNIKSYNLQEGIAKIM